MPTERTPGGIARGRRTEPAGGRISQQHRAGALTGADSQTGSGPLLSAGSIVPRAAVAWALRTGTCAARFLLFAFHAFALGPGALALGVSAVRRRAEGVDVCWSAARTGSSSCRHPARIRTHRHIDCGPGDHRSPSRRLPPGLDSAGRPGLRSSSLRRRLPDRLAVAEAASQIHWTLEVDFSPLPSPAATIPRRFVYSLP